MRSALLFIAVLLPQASAAADPGPANEHEQFLKANKIEPTPAGIRKFLQPMSDKRLKRLVRQLGDDSYARRERATKALSELPVPVGPLYDATLSSDPEVRYRAQIILKRIRHTTKPDVLLAVFKTVRGKPFAGSVPAVLGMIPHLESETLIAAASEAVSSAAQPEHFTVLRTTLRRGKHVQMRLAALRALMRLNGEKIVGDLKRMVDEDNEQVRLAAAVALVSLQRRESLDVLVKLLGSHDVAIRAAAVRYLRNMTGKRFGYLAIDRSPAREQAAIKWTAWVSRNGATAKLNLNPAEVLAASPKLTIGVKLLHRIASPDSTAYCVSFSPDGKRIASCSGNGKLRVWDISAERLVWEQAASSDGITVRSVAYSPDGKMLATGGYDKTVRLWDAKTGRPLRTLRGHTQSIRPIAFSPDGKWLASGGDDTTVIVWNVATGKAVHVLKGHKATVRTVTFSPDSRLVASGGSDETIRLWDRKTGRQKRELLGQNASVRSVSFSPDGGTLASGGLDNSVRLWDVASGRERVILGRHTLSIKSLTYSPDGRIIASAGNDRVVNIWDTDSGRLIRRLNEPGNTVWHVTISKDGKMLAACGSDREIFIWSLDSFNSAPESKKAPKSPESKSPSPRPAPRPKRK